MIEVSIVIPVYNPTFLQVSKCLSSVVSSNFENYECILVDDSNSTILKSYYDEYLKDDIRFIYIRNQCRKGIANSLNTGIQIARSSYIVRLDIDDVNRPNRLIHQLNFIKSHNYDIIGSVNINSIYSFLKFPRSNICIRLLLSFTNPIIHPSVIFKKEIFQRYKYENIQYCEDLDLWLKLRNKNYKFFNIKENLIDYSKPFFVRKPDHWIQNINVRIRNLNINKFFLLDFIGIFISLFILVYSLLISKFKSKFS